MSPTTDHTPLDRAIARLASHQHGVIALYQLIQLGLTRSGVTKRVSAGRLHPVHRGVYTVGHQLLTIKGHWMAAVLACGEGAVLSYASAAQLWGLIRRGGRTIHVTSPTRAGRKREGIAVHAGKLTAADVTALERIPCTSVPRTLLDLAEQAPKQVLQRAVERAVQLELFDLIAIKELLDRSNGRRGAPRLQHAIALYDDAPTRSVLERAFLELVKRAGLPRPEINVPIDAYVVDFLWRDQRLIIETDGGDHATRGGRSKDYARDRRLRNLGWRVERFSWYDVMYEPEAVAQELRELLSAAA